jgi:hypothetical protein
MQPVGTVVNGVTGRMGYHQHSVSAAGGRRLPVPDLEA